MYSLTHSLLRLPFLFLLILLLVPFSAYAQSYRNISLGSSLTATGDNTSWPSPSGDFAFGFRHVDNDRFLLAIWFDKIPDRTIVWYANGDNPAPRGSQVELTTKGRLVLKGPRGNELWEAETAKGEIRHGAMLDNGNFVLVEESSTNYLWESFKNPTDTILPTQFLEVNKHNNKLSSRVNDSTYTTGRFRLRLQENGNFAMYAVGFPSLTENEYEAYYNLFLLSGSDPKVNQFVFNESGNIYIISRNGSIVNLKWDNIVPATNVYYRATLDFDGVFTQYSHPKTSDLNSRWTVMRLMPDDICDAMKSRLGSGACGYNSYCILTSNRRPSCECPPGYELVDSNNRFSDCKPNFMLPTCQEEDTKNATDLFELQSLRNADWPTSDYEMMESYNEKDCRSSCLNDCLCAIALFKEGTCWKKKLPLPNGRLNAAVNGIALIKTRKVSGFPKPDLDPILGPTRIRSTLNLVVSVLLGCSVFFNFILLAATFLVYFFMDKKLRKKQHKSTTLRSSLRSFTYLELEEATDGFKQELGRGAFGIVYKGSIEEIGSTEFIAVKKLDKVFGEGEKEFKTEVSAIGQTHHKNLVRLLGFCDEGKQRLLVYEFMSNSSLADHLFGICKPDWNQRVQIAFGISRGLMYLHEECSTQIIHCDIKPQNILLDDNFTARISDFGLAKLLVSNQTRTYTGIRGTRGYVAPEWFRNTPVSAKVDVYSFGVMLLEIICCRKGVEIELGEEEVKAILTDWAYDCFRNGKLQNLVEDEEVMNDMKRFERLVMIAIWCIQEEPSLRPSMKKVTQMLEGVLEVSVPPCPYQINSYIGEYSVPDDAYQYPTTTTSDQ
ncbi:hypothetical protein C5167_031671 [Papaver somniferum]|uniref:Receptor-like serine/threonine-protein kinase n=1 Tax=Papaver somniferum TaxID=3469 RepID=A0A4Y7K7Y0_PAPSO|nr:G-type lectin S-receptor-like serine/threonine-protein kinase LECRK4 [Papaver somniferum]RZC68432.1 hypothetical protein C5167_031671 [Papaver somniferum]